jgi:hypothetical protein
MATGVEVEGPVVGVVRRRSSIRPDCDDAVPAVKEVTTAANV